MFTKQAPQRTAEIIFMMRGSFETADFGVSGSEVGIVELPQK